MGQTSISSRGFWSHVLLAEAVLIASFGGMVGFAIALPAAAFLTGVLQVPFIFNAPVVLIGFVFSAAVGVLFGYVPARKAARLDPIFALRHEQALWPVCESGARASGHVCGGEISQNPEWSLGNPTLDVSHPAAKTQRQGCAAGAGGRPSIEPA